METVEHRLAVGLESRCEQVVQVRLVWEIDSRNGDRAGVTLFARARRCAGLFTLATGIHGGGDRRLDLRRLLLLPVLEGWVILHECGHPLVRLLRNVRIHAVLQVFLHVCVEEEIKTRDVAEGDVLCKGCSLFFPQWWKEFEVQIANLLLCNGWKWIYRVKPNIQLWCFSQLGEACILKLCCFFNTVDGSHETSSFRHTVSVFVAEVCDVVIIFGLELITIGAFCLLCQRMEFSKHEVSGVETLWYNSTHCVQLLKRVRIFLNSKIQSKGLYLLGTSASSYGQIWLTNVVNYSRGAFAGPSLMEKVSSILSLHHFFLSSWTSFGLAAVPPPPPPPDFSA